MTFEELASKAVAWWKAERAKDGLTMVEYLRSRGVTDPEQLEEQEDRVGLGSGVIVGLYLAHLAETE